MLKILLPAIGLFFVATAAKSADNTSPAVIKDHYFLSLRCDNYLSDITIEERKVLSEAVNTLIIEDIIGFLEKEDSLLKRIQKEFKGTGINFNPGLLQAKEQLEGMPKFSDIYTNANYSSQNAVEAISAVTKIRNAKKRTGAQREEIENYMYCQIASVAAGLGAYANFSETYASYVQARPQSADVGYFNIKVDKGEAKSTVGTGNRYTEPQRWEGSRFYIVHASFKNMDTESRMPIAGSLMINYDGKEYEFDSIEPILLDGYNLWMKKINPLIAMKTKLVYRIPDEIQGDVYWKPGRNSDDTKLWVGALKAVK